MALLNFFSKKTESVVGLDIGSSSIKVVELAKRGDFVELVTYGLLEISPYGGKEIGRAVQLSVEQTVEAISDVMREAKVKSNVSGIAIPFKSSFMRLIEVPQVTEKELKKIVPLEARKYIPVPIDEVSLDWGLVPQVKTGLSDGGKKDKINVLLVAVHNDILNRFRSISDEAKLDNKFLEVESYSSMRSIAPDSNEALMLCDFGASATKVYIIYKGFVLISHVINTGSQDITLNISRSMDLPIDQAEIMKREKGFSGDDKDLSEIINLTLGQITQELERTKEDFEQKYNTNITNVQLIGGGAQLKGLSSRIESVLKVEVAKGNAFGQIKTPSFLNETIKEIGPEFAVAVGCALRVVSS